MTTDSEVLAARLVSELRSPLARVELATSQLLRELHTPLAQELAASISEAVEQADREIERIVALLSPLSPPGRQADLREVVHRLRARVAPVLDARGTACEVREIGPDRLCGDPVLVEQAALALARIGSSLVGPGGRLSLEITGEGARLGIAVGCRAPDGRALQSDPERAFAGLLPWAARHGGSLKNGGQPGSRSSDGGQPGSRSSDGRQPGSLSEWRAALWLPGGGA